MMFRKQTTIDTHLLTDAISSRDPQKLHVALLALDRVIKSSAAAEKIFNAHFDLLMQCATTNRVTPGSDASEAIVPALASVLNHYPIRAVPALLSVIFGNDIHQIDSAAEVLGRMRIQRGGDWPSEISELTWVAFARLLKGVSSETKQVLEKHARLFFPDYR